jgi:hypothetical protein
MVNQVISNISQAILNPLITLLFAAAMVYFLWGGFLFIRGADSEEGRNIGRRHMIYGIIGMFIMLSVFGIINILLGTFGIAVPN